MGQKKSAKASVEKLSRGLARETPARQGRSRVEGGPAAAGDQSTRRTKRERERMVRVSVDLPRPQHKYLRDFAYDAESDGMSVVRALLEEMLEDEDLAGRIVDRLADE